MSFDFLLEGTSAKSISNVRISGSNKPELRVTPTAGNLILNGIGASLMSANDGSYIAIAELPNSFQNGQVPVKYEFYTREEDPKAVYAVHLGHPSNEEDGVDAQGNLARQQGSGLQFSSKTPWTLLNGDTENNHVYSMTRMFGFAFDGEKLIPMTDENVDTIEGEGYIFTKGLPAFEVTDNKDEALKGSAFYALQLDNSYAKQVRGGKDDDGTEEVVEAEAETVDSEGGLFED
jgi:hypothetical protein